MTIAVDLGRKATKQTNTQTMTCSQNKNVHLWITRFTCERSVIQKEFQVLIS